MQLHLLLTWSASALFATPSELRSYNRQCMLCKPKRFTIWLCTENAWQPLPRWLTSHLALTQVHSKPESKLFGKIRLLSILGIFNVGTLIWTLINLGKHAWTQRVRWHTHWQNCYRSFWLWLSIKPAFVA